MGYWINKTVWFLTSPLDVGLVLLVCGWWIVNGQRNLAHWGRRAALLGALLILVFSLPITGHILGYGLECNYEERDPKDVPEGDVALDLGGSWQRAWYAAELVKAGKAKTLIASGVGIEREDAVLIRNLGVTEDQLIIDGAARNTEENVKNAREIIEQSNNLNNPSNRTTRVLVVTTAVHMPRSLLLMQKYWPEAKAIPAPTEFIVKRRDAKGINWGHFVPSLCSLEANLAFYHEYLGYAAYRWVK